MHLMNLHFWYQSQDYKFKLLHESHFYQFYIPPALPEVQELISGNDCNKKKNNPHDQATSVVIFVTVTKDSKCIFTITRPKNALFVYCRLHGIETFSH